VTASSTSAPPACPSSSISVHRCRSSCTGEPTWERFPNPPKRRWARRAGRPSWTTRPM